MSHAGGPWSVTTGVSVGAGVSSVVGVSVVVGLSVPESVVGVVAGGSLPQPATDERTASARHQVFNRLMRVSVRVTPAPAAPIAPHERACDERSGEKQCAALLPKVA